MAKDLKVSLVVGARPNFVKVAPLIVELDKESIDTNLIHTGQHWSEKLSNEMFTDLKLREPDFHLDTPVGSMSSQLGFMLNKLDENFSSLGSNNIVGVVGDVTSTLAGAIAAKNSKMPLFHIEAGLRSGVLSAPEERNRIMVDHISDLCFAPSEDAVLNLRNEGIKDQNISLVGNIMIDSLISNRSKIDHTYKEIVKRLNISRDYFILTLHRRINLNKSTLEDIFSSLDNFSDSYTVYLPAHPRLMEYIKNNSVKTFGIELIDSLPYLSFLSLMANSSICLTDSGGIQEETSILGIPCLTLRSETERPITVEIGTNKVIGTKKEDIIESVNLVLETSDYKESEIPLWDGKTSKRIVQNLKEKFT